MGAKFLIKNFLKLIAKLLLKILQISVIFVIAFALLYCFYSAMAFAFKNVLPSISISVLSNFLIFAGIIIFVAKKLNIKAQLENAENSINTTIHESEKTKAESETKLSSIEESMKHIEKEIDLILEESGKNSKLVGEKILEEANKNALTIKENATRALENSTMLLKNDLIRRASLASVEIAKAHIIEELKKNSELHNKLIDESIEALEAIEAE